jgi:tetratricopeptide (TPR) repeat protein
MAVLLLYLLIAAETPELILTDTNVYSYGKALMEEGDYYRAIGEFKRLIYYFPTSNLADSANFMIGVSYYKAGRFSESYSTFEDFAASKAHERNHLFYSAVLYAGKSKLKDGSYDEAREVFSYISPENVLDESIIYDANKYLLLSNLFLKDFNGARTAVEGSAFGREERADFIKLIEMGESLPKKSIPLAAGMSTLIPGSGQVYSKRYFDGLISFLFNTYNAYALYTLLKKDASSSKLLVQVSITIPFYLGNIYGAALAAHRYNERKEANYYRKLSPFLEE